MVGQHHASAAWPLGKSAGIHFTEGWVGTRAGLYGYKDKISWYNRVRTQNRPAHSDAILTYHDPTEVFQTFPNFIPVSLVTLSSLTDIPTLFTWLSNYTRHHKSEHHIVIQ